MITSAGNKHDGLTIQCDTQGKAKVRVHFAKLALLKGEYSIAIYLMCENAIHFYDQARLPTKFNVHQQSLEVGVVSLPRHWEQI
ncbi:efflux ABC transporter, ATP-binding protein [Beggiatoa sp. PS]|nr:efflux ABC transporter, ATP-binding protein [Beggiatoa sp. PS]